MVENKGENSQSQIKKFNDLIVYNIGRIYVLLSRYLTKKYKEFGLNPAQFNLLMLVKYIGKGEGGSQIELGDKLFVSAANITKLIDGLERKKWVRRVASRTDRRVKLIKITSQGSLLLDKVWGSHSQALNMLLRGFSEPEKEQFHGFLERFKQELEG